jgi:hypothetical protein
LIHLRLFIQFFFLNFFAIRRVRNLLALIIQLTLLALKDLAWSHVTLFENSDFCTECRLAIRDLATAK